MTTESKHNYQKRIRELEIDNRKLKDTLYDYRTAVLDVFDGISEIASKQSTSLNTGWVLGRIKRLLK